MALLQINLSIILVISYAYSLLSLSIEEVGFVEYFIIIPILLLQRKTQTSLLRTSSRWSLPHPTLPVVLDLCRMLSLASYSKPDPDPILIELWSIVLAFLLYRVSAPPGIIWKPNYLLNKYCISPLRLIFITFSLNLRGDVSSRHIKMGDWEEMN